MTKQKRLIRAKRKAKNGRVRRNNRPSLKNIAKMLARKALLVGNNRAIIEEQLEGQLEKQEPPVNDEPRGE